MSICPKCGSTVANGKFKCPSCGTLVAYRPMPPKGPSLWDRIMRYKSYIILVLLAIVIASTRAVLALTTIYWVLIIGLLVAVAVLWLRGRNRARTYGPPRPRYGEPGPPRKKHANVIPFKRKKDPKSRAKPDR